MLFLLILGVLGQEGFDKENAVVELDDSNFEHLTQAATGATTGDWFVKFYREECQDCKRLEVSWVKLAEKVAEDTELTVSIAKVNIDMSPELVKRFEIKSLPVLLYFRLGVVYNVIGIEGVDNLYEMIKGQGFKKFNSRKVPGLSSFMSEVSVSEIFNLPYWVYGVFVCVFGIAVVFLVPKKIKTS
ncbi:hypothetical protein SteCoe_19794 [Stentor coeruleus]|uniref:Thioredoxin domain-containing protein n=1 Tax=Stentor coeruleus TaxID=5963 RepID=A0A1R2BTE8_9CILI|nr:hypothetical protein SteCoe_19794 [Stentor coeruleus]